MYGNIVSKNRLDTYMLRVHLFSFFTIQTPQALAMHAPFNLK